MRATFNLRKASLLAATATVLFTACKKDPTGNNPEPTPPVQTKLKKISQGEDVLEFVYGNNGLQAIKTNNDQTTDGELKTFNISYAADNTKISELKTEANERIVPNYTNGQLSSAGIYDAANNLLFTTRYTFQNGVLQSTVSGANGIDVLKTSFEYGADENVHIATNWMFNPTSGKLEISGSTLYEYDAKMNPVHIHKPLLYLLLQNTPRYNVTKETDYDENNRVSEIREYSYQYNNQNLPQSATIKTTVPGGGSTTANVVYSYQ